MTNFQKYMSEYTQSVANPEEFWAKQAEKLSWQKKWDRVLEYDFYKPEVKWFIGAKLNITENCIDRHLPARAHQTAILWESNDPSEPSRKITYQQLSVEVNRAANMLKANGIKKGDRVCIYMPMIPETAFAMLACARVGAVHSVVFAGFSAGSLVDRINDSNCKMVLTADGAYRGDKRIDLKSIVDEALKKCPSVDKCIVLNRTNLSVSMQPVRDLWWHEEIRKTSDVCVAEEMDAEDLLFILYTSGSTGKPKGMV
ncbi:MAG: AMP-binding protein, partial [bacterium]